MNMIGACWMRRSLGEPVSALLIDSNNSIIAGGWNGILTKWSAEGDELWSIQLPDRIGSISVTENAVYVCAGLHLVAVNSNQGELIWQHALEGSADEVTTFNGLIYATSSVYDIEHNDFIDSAIWCFDGKGEKVWETHMDERPWTMIVSSDQLLVGLGRPKMGAGIVENDGSLTYLTLESTSPVTAGTDSIEGAIFGHANGDLTTSNHKVLSGLGESISVICATDSKLITIGKDNELTTLKSNFEPQWSSNVGPISTLSSGFLVDDKSTIWVGIQQGINGLLKVICQGDGETISSMVCGKVNCIHSNGNRVAAGDEKGELFVWQDEMFNRRLTGNISDDNDERRESMRERLKSLRKR
tara:strand:+ start:3044 stop:4114 length:1071 start_codon:yes stop_codon:yes gene_type:complete